MAQSADARQDIDNRALEAPVIRELDLIGVAAARRIPDQRVRRLVAHGAVGRRHQARAARRPRHDDDRPGGHPGRPAVGADLPVIGVERQ